MWNIVRTWRVYFFVSNSRFFYRLWMGCFCKMTYGVCHALIFVKRSKTWSSYVHVVYEKPSVHLILFTFPLFFATKDLRVTFSWPWGHMQIYATFGASNGEHNDRGCILVWCNLVVKEWSIVYESDYKVLQYFAIYLTLWPLNDIEKYCNLSLVYWFWIYDGSS